jgi:hypothetical protein
VTIKEAVGGVVMPVLAALVPCIDLLAEQVDEDRCGDISGIR